MSAKVRITIGLLLGLLVISAFDNAAFSQLTDSQREQIQSAVPEKASVEPRQPRKLLVFNLDIWDGKVRQGHESIPASNYAFELMGEKTGAYQAVFSSDVSVFKRENIGQYDAICFNNTCGVIFDDAELKKSLLDYVYGGGGIIGIHSAAATFVQWPDYHYWPEFGEMLGGYEDGGHPWKGDEAVAIKIDDPDHAINAAFDRKSFEITDQIFQFRAPYSRETVRVLISIDTEKTDMDPSRRFLPERQKDKDFPISWVKDYGRGRIFFSAFGHNPDTFWNPMLLKHFLDGIQFALGDLDAPTTPSAKLSGAVRNRETLDWQLGIQSYSFKNNTFFEAVDKTVSLGLRYIEGIPDQKVSSDLPKNLDPDLTDDEIIKVRRKLLDAGVRMPVYYFHKIPPDEQFCTRLFEFCRKLGVETIVGEPEPEAIDVIEKFCERYDINLGIHNHGKGVSPLYYDPDNVLSVVGYRSKRIGICPDIGHWIEAGFDPVEALKKTKDRIISIHLRDVDQAGAEGHDVPLTTGVAKLDEFLRQAYELEIKPTLWAMQYGYDFDDNVSEIAQSVELFDKAIQPIVSYHRAYIGRTRGARRRAEVSEEERGKIESAIPASAPAKAKKPRRLLVFDRSIGHGKHPSVPHANLAVTLMGQKTGAYETVVTEDPSVFEKETLNTFDAVFLNNTVGTFLDSDEQLRENLLDFVYSGGGLLGNHATSVAFKTSPGWTETFPEFSQMLGTAGASHRQADEVVTAKIDDPSHPLNAVFGGKSFQFTDEFFRFHEVYSRDKVRVLFSIDVDNTDMNQGRSFGPCFRDDNDYALAWVKSYGAGRVYYTTIGHNPFVFWDKMFLEHFLAAIQFALGDLEGPTVASAKVDEPELAAEKLGWRLAVQHWSFNRFSFYESIEKARSLGLSFVEVYSFGPDAGQAISPERKDEMFTYAMKKELQREVRHKVDEAGLRMLNCYIGDFGKTEKATRKIFEFAKDMGIETLVGEPGPEQFDMLEKLCDEYDINLAIHNHYQGTSQYWDPKYLAGLLKGRSKRMGACPDTGHWLRAGVDAVEGLKTLEGRILDVHLKDLNEAGNVKAHDIPWGTGKSGVAAILAELKRQGYRGPVVIEYEHNWENSLPEIARCIEFFKETVIELAR